jgi:hypothetical protein
MRRSALCGGLVLICSGLALAILGDGSVWERLLGLQIMMMGLYTAVAARQSINALRLALRARLALTFAEVAWWALTPSSPWWLLAFGLEAAWLLSTPGVVRNTGAEVRQEHTEPPVPSARNHFPSRLHNLMLGSIPLGEGIGALVFGALYGPIALGVETPDADLPAAALFGVHTLYLALFWGVLVWARDRKTMMATTLGRVGVAIAFVVFHLTGIVDDDARFIILAPLLVLSAAWTVVELLGWLGPWMRGRGAA